MINNFFLDRMKLASQKKKIISFHNLYKNERCFIIGNGPSLTIDDLNTLHKNNEFCFGSNRIYICFEQTAWRPSFYTISDGVMLAEYFDEIKNLPLKHIFISDYYLKHGGKRMPGVYTYNLDTTRYFPYFPKFADDVSIKMYEGFTVTYINIQLAVYMGFTQLYLLGVDFQYSNYIDTSGIVIDSTKQDYFMPTYIKPGEHRNIPQLNNSLQAYRKAEMVSQVKNYKIFNATRGGKLEVFERINFDSIWQSI